MNFLEQVYPSALVAQATQTPLNTLQSWFKRGVIVGQQVRPEGINGGGSQGRHLRWNFHLLMEVAIAQSLINLGLSDLKTAFGVAAHFAYGGEGPLPGQPERLPGFPYKVSQGTTLLAVAGGTSTLVHWIPGVDCMAIIRAELGKPEGFVLLDVEAVFRRVVMALGADPAAVLTAAYSKR